MSRQTIGAVTVEQWEAFGVDNFGQLSAKTQNAGALCGASCEMSIEQCRWLCALK
jgi:hypothetical protein